MNKLLSAFFVTALTIGAPSNLIYALGSGDYYVDPAAPYGGDGSAATPWTTIGDALSSGALSSGATLHLAEGNYESESWPLDIVPGVHYQGAGVGTIMTSPPSMVGFNAMFRLEALPGQSTTQFSNMTISPEWGDGISVSGSSATTSLVVDNISLDSNASLVNVYTENVKGDYTISNCDVIEGDLLALEMFFTSSYSYSGSSHIENSLNVHDNTVAIGDFDLIDVENFDGAQIANFDVDITNNEVDLCDDNPIVITVYDTPIANITITSNRFDWSGDEVLTAQFSSIGELNFSYSSNVMSDSEDDGLTLSMSQYGSNGMDAALNISNNSFDVVDDEAIEIYTYYSYGSLSATTIRSNTTITGADEGIVLASSISGYDYTLNATIHNNTVSDSDFGIWLSASAYISSSKTIIDVNRNVTATDNELTKNYETAVGVALHGDYSGGFGSPNFNFDFGTLATPGNNTIHSNGGAHPENSSSSFWGSSAIFVSNSSVFSGIEINALGNDWGTSDLAEIEDQIYHKVDETDLMLVNFDSGAPLPPSAPIAVYDARTPAECGPVVIDVADNDLDVNNDLDLDSVVITQNPAHGTVVVLGGGLVEYTADYGWVGADTFNYTISDVTGLVSNIATVQVDNPGDNQLPEAIYDAEQMSEAAGSITFNIVNNDNSPSGRTLDPATILITQQPHKGTVTNHLDGTVTYTFTDDMSGALTTTDTFNYTIRDNCGALSNVATVEVEISRDDAPADTPTDNSFKVVASEMAAGKPATLSVVGAAANSTIKVYASRVHQLSNTQFGLSELGGNRVKLGNVQTNMFGSGSMSFNVPASLQGQTVWIQAFDSNEGALSSAASADVN